MRGTWLAARGAEIATCLGFFSRLPVPHPQQAIPFGNAIGLLPLASLVIGLCSAVPLELMSVAGLPPSCAAIVAVSAGLLATGGLHEDGLADTADGFGGGRSRDRKLEIMRDSRIGTYGVLALGIALLWRVASLAALVDRFSALGAAVAMLGGATLSRTLALAPLALLPPARDDGLGRGVGGLSRSALLVSAVSALLVGIALPLAAGMGPGHAAVATTLAIIVTLGIVRLAKRQIGGHTGDVAGACQVAAESAYLLGLLLFPGA